MKDQNQKSKQWWRNLKISLNIELKGKIEKKNQIQKKIKEYKFPKNLMMMDEIVIFLNDWSQLDPIIKTSDMDSEAIWQHKRQIGKNNNAKSLTNQNN